MMHGQHPWRQLGSSVAQSAGSAALKYGEGAAMKEIEKIPIIGNIFKSTHKPTGSQSDPIWVKSADGGAGSAASSMGKGASSILSSLLGGNGASDAGGAMGAGAASLIGGLFGSGASGAAASIGAAGVAAFAEGGMIPSNMPSIVGEKGPELFMPSTSGRIIPNGSFGGDTHIHVDARGSADPAAMEAAAHRVFGRYAPHMPGMAVAAMRDANRRRPLSKAR